MKPNKNYTDERHWTGLATIMSVYKRKHMGSHRETKGQTDFYKCFLGALMIVEERKSLKSMLCAQKCSERKEI